MGEIKGRKNREQVIMIIVMFCLIVALLLGLVLLLDHGGESLKL